MDMQRLNPGMMVRYEIEDRRPGRINVVEFGMGEAMLGVVNRLLDGTGVGVVCVEAGETGYAERLRAQAGLYTVVIRGYEGESPVYREQVTQCVADARAAADLEALAADAGLEFGIVDDTPEARALAGRFTVLRRGLGLKDVPLLCLGGSVEGATCCPALAEGLAFRSEADEAAKLCRDMNYLDGMLHLAEPFARLTLAVPEEFRIRFPLDRVEGVSFADASAFEAALRFKRALFDGGIFLMSAAGWLNGCDTLCDCMRHERLRRFVGEGFTEELMPALEDMDRRAVESAVIECFARYENPLNRNRLLRAAGGLIARFIEGPCRALRALAERDFEPPRRLSFALAAVIMLYAGARLNPESGQYEVVRGKTAESLHDDPERLKIFSTLSHDMPPESLAYAALADRELWGGLDLREIDGLEARVALDIAAMQREPGYLPDGTD